MNLGSNKDEKTAPADVALIRRKSGSKFDLAESGDKK